MKKQTSIIEKIEPEIDSIQLVKIVDEKSLASATEVLSQANKYLKDLTADKEKLTAPLNAALKEVRSRYKPIEIKLEGIIANIRQSMSSYQTEQIRLQKAEEDKIAERVAKGTLKPETGIKKMENMDKPVDKVNTQSGKISFKEVEKFEVEDISKLPIEYHLVDEVAIRNAMKANIHLEGVRYYTEQVPINNLR